jgi:hypothetical protein
MGPARLDLDTFCAFGRDLVAGCPVLLEDVRGDAAMVGYLSAVELCPLSYGLGVNGRTENLRTRSTVAYCPAFDPPMIEVVDKRADSALDHLGKVPR